MKLVKTSFFYSLILFIILLFFFHILSLFRIYFFGAGLGNSMYPTLKEGDLVLMIPYQILKIFNFKPKVGDIIVFESPENEDLVCHRIIEIINNKIVTKGDYSPIKDPYTITEEDIIAIVPQFSNTPLHIPFLGFILYDFYSNSFLRFSIISLLIVYEIFLLTFLFKK